MKTQLIFGILLLRFFGFAQDYHFSQYNKIQLLHNPALTGFGDGYERFAVSQRNQWLASGTHFSTSAASAEFTLGKDNYARQAYAGVGLQFVNDVGGLSRWRNTSAALNVSGVIPITYLQQFSAGLQLGLTNRAADISRLTFPSQWSGSGYDNTLPSGEENFNTFSYLDAGAGFFYKYGTPQTQVMREKEFRFEAGVAAFHLNRPKVRYNGISADPLDMRFVAMMNFYYTFTNMSGMDFYLMQGLQGKHNETTLGVFVKNRIDDGSRRTGAYNDTYYSLGAYIRSSGMLIPAVQFDVNNFQFGFSYDIIVSRLRRAAPGGTVELHLAYRTRGKSLFKR